jgi:hypothetical protein
VPRLPVGCIIPPMPRSVTSFEIGNSANLKLTDELAELFINTLKATGRISVSAGRCCVGARTVRTWLAKGREENAEEPFKSFADKVERARAEFLAVAAQRMGQLAIGGVLNLPKYDKLNQLVRDENGEIEFEERYFPPNVNALAHVLDRIDPEPNLQPPGPDVPELPKPTEDERRRQAIADYELVRQALTILEELGQPLAVSLAGSDIETTATTVAEYMPPLPAGLETIDVSPADERAKESEPAPTTSATASATTIEPDPSDKPPEAF